MIKYVTDVSNILSENRARFIQSRVNRRKQRELEYKLMLFKESIDRLIRAYPTSADLVIKSMNDYSAALREFTEKVNKSFQM
jgi:hypothetical protein